MKCPYCNKEMIEGVVQSARQIFFAPEAHYFFLHRNAAKYGEITLSSHNWTVPTCTAFHCPSCKKVMIDYSADIEQAE